MSRSKRSLEEEVKERMPEFVDEVVSLSVDDLNARLSRLAKDNEANEEAKEEDDELTEARELVTELSAPYREAKKFIRLRSKYIIQLLKEKGAE